MLLGARVLLVRSVPRSGNAHTLPAWQLNAGEPVPLGRGRWGHVGLAVVDAEIKLSLCLIEIALCPLGCRHGVEYTSRPHGVDDCAGTLGYRLR